MKKIIKPIFTIVSVLLVSVFLQAASAQLFEKNIAISDFTRLTIKSNLRVVLVESEKVDTVHLEGNKKFLESVIVLQAGDQVVIRAKSFKDLKKEGTVYIPVQGLRHLEVNAEAKILSYTTIQSPELNVFTSGDAIVSIDLKGKLNILDQDRYRSSFNKVYTHSNTPIYLTEFNNN